MPTLRKLFVTFVATNYLKSDFMPNYVSRYSLKFLYISILCLPFLLSSCDNCTFISDNVQFAAVSFYGADGKVKSKKFDKVTGVFSRTGEAMPNALFTDTTATIFKLPIFTRVDTTIFVFTQYVTLNAVRDTLLDTLMMRYKVKVEVLPPDCGYDEAITDVEVFYTTFDSAEVVKKDLKELETATTAIPHIKIIDN